MSPSFQIALLIGAATILKTSLAEIDAFVWKNPGTLDNIGFSVDYKAINRDGNVVPTNDKLLKGFLCEDQNRSLQIGRTYDLKRQVKPLIQMSRSSYLICKEEYQTIYTSFFNSTQLPSNFTNQVNAAIQCFLNIVNVTPCPLTYELTPRERQYQDDMMALAIVFGSMLSPFVLLGIGMGIYAAIVVTCDKLEQRAQAREQQKNAAVIEGTALLALSFSSYGSSVV